MFCTKCKKTITGDKAGAHKRWCGHNAKKNKIIKKICLCGNEFETTAYRPRKNCSRSCASKNITSETREKISNSRKKYLADNPEKHPWKKKDKFTSVPCENIKRHLRELDISFVAEYAPLDDRYFAIDIAFPQEKVGIEVNGNQHYNSDKTLKKYYQERHDLIEAAGWKIHNIHYSLCFSSDDMDKIVTHLKKSARLEFLYEFEVRSKKEKKSLQKEKKSLHGSWKKAGAARTKQWELAQQKYVPIVKNSGIDFSKFGWVKKVAPLIQQKPQKVNKWMRKIMPEFYNTHCFKRKNNSLK